MTKFKMFQWYKREFHLLDDKTGEILQRSNNTDFVYPIYNYGNIGDAWCYGFVYTPRSDRFIFGDYALTNQTFPVEYNAFDLEPNQRYAIQKIFTEFSNIMERRRA